MHKKNPLTQRYALCVEYDGSAYHGWQRQSHQISVQEVVEKAISSVANHQTIVHCAGRTDTGVHGIGQIVHFDTLSCRTDYQWLLGINANLPPDVSIRWVKAVNHDFHARFSALGRRYQYIIINRKTRSALWRDRCVWIREPLDEMAMQTAAQSLLGEHDFSSYRALGCQAHSPVRRISHISVTRQQDRVILDVSANGFLHHMIRNIAGVLISIGRNKRPIHWCKDVLDYRDRTKGGVTAKPQGLYFTHVDYPEEFELPVLDDTQR